MLGAGMTQAAVADACGVTDRTIRNWLKLKRFQTMIERARERAERQAARDATCVSPFGASATTKAGYPSGGWTKARGA